MIIFPGSIIIVELDGKEARVEVSRKKYQNGEVGFSADLYGAETDGRHIPFIPLSAVIGESDYGPE